MALYGSYKYSYSKLNKKNHSQEELGVNALVVLSLHKTVQTVHLRHYLVNGSKAADVVVAKVAVVVDAAVLQQGNLKRDCVVGSVLVAVHGNSKAEPAAGSPRRVADANVTPGGDCVNVVDGRRHGAVQLVQSREQGVRVLNATDGHNVSSAGHSDRRSGWKGGGRGKGARSLGCGHGGVAVSAAERAGEKEIPLMQ